MRLWASSLELLVAAEREHIILHDIGFTVVLMKPAVRRAINDIALRQNSAASYIEIDSPAAVSKTGDVMPQIVQNPGSRLFAQRINTPHVAQNRSISIRFHSDVMHVI